jgi:hypothetical protein
MIKLDLALLLVVMFAYALGGIEKDNMYMTLLYIICCKLCAAADKYLEQTK